MKTKDLEPIALYQAVLTLRACGRRVRRAGRGSRMHLVNGRRCNGKQLIAMARAFARREEEQK